MEARLTASYGSSLRRLAVLPLAALAALSAAATANAGTPAAPVPSPTTVATTTMSNWLTDNTDPTSTDEGSLAWIEQMLHVPQAWSAGYTGTGVDVALVDSGVAPVDGLDGDNVVNGPDLSFEAGYADVAHRDTFGHGTHLASIIAGKSADLTGIAPGARIVSLKVATATGATDVTQIIAAIDWVVRHAHDGGRNIRVLNLSYGTDSIQPYDVDPLSHAVERAWQAGIVVVAAAGNEGATRQQLADPASDPYVLAVGADDTHGTLSPADDTVADFTQRGSTARQIDIVAPGLHVLGLTVPNGYVDQTHPEGKVGDRFIRGSGTSQATAVVSGVLALLAQRYPDATPDQLKYLVTSTAQQGEAGVLDAGGALAGDPDLAPAQTWPASTGTGSLEAARGSAHVAIGDAVLSGEQDIFGTPWTGPGSAANPAWLTLGDTGWTASTDWTGTTWDSRTWVSRTWVAGEWDSRTWVSEDWLSRTWVSRTWVSRTWVVGDWITSNWASADPASSDPDSRTWAGGDWS